MVKNLSQNNQTKLTNQPTNKKQPTNQTRKLIKSGLYLPILRVCHQKGHSNLFLKSCVLERELISVHHLESSYARFAISSSFEGQLGEVSQFINVITAFDVAFLKGTNAVGDYCPHLAVHCKVVHPSF